ncbi:MAG: histone deacetylase family protein [Hyphomicrobiales bacterium]|nr:histone deacetylase family protein [Hyphomicrobiales bacterium]
MTTLLVYHPSFLDHLTPLGHPERPDRLRAIDRALEIERFAALEREQAPFAPAEKAFLAHPSQYVKRIEDAAPEDGFVSIDADTSMSPGSWEAALRAIGGGCLAVDEVMTGKVENAFCAMRPPGHHAERIRAMGFCLFNTAAICAFHAAEAHGAERVAVIDFDVHHGNGTQDIFWDKPDFFYASTHQMPLYPGTGAVNETGKDDAGNIVNAPLAPGDGTNAFRSALEDRIVPALLTFKPDLVIISAGFDAHERDPLANLNLTEDDFAWATKTLMDVADRTADGRVVSILEGGYDLVGLATSVASHVDALMYG